MTVVTADDRWTVAPTMATVIGAEKQFGESAQVMFADGNVSITKMAWLAWEQTRADGIAVKPFEDWVKSLVDLEMDNDAVPLDVTT